MNDDDDARDRADPPREVDALIDALADGPGEAAEFSIDGARAREKLAQYALPDPHLYVVLLVGAAALKGAKRIVFAIDADDMRCRFDGQPFTETELAQLFTAFFSRADDAEARARRELALALNTALGQNPKFVEVRSSDAAHTVRLRLAPGEEGVVETCESNEPERGTAIHVKRRFGLGLVGRKAKDALGKLPEELALRARCRFAGIAIELEGTRLDAERVRDEPATGLERWSEAIRHPTARGRVGFREDAPETGALHLLQNEVLIATHEAGEAWPHLHAIIHAPHLTRDASQFDFNHDEAYDGLLQAIHAAAHHVVRALAAALKRGSVPMARKILRAAVRTELRDIDPLPRRGRIDERRPEMLMLDAHLLDAAIYAYGTPTQIMKGFVSLRQIVETAFAGRDRIGCAQGHTAVPKAAGRTDLWPKILVVEHPADRAFLRQLLDDKFSEL